ncbi:MAG: hypothetical protein KatS3mg110_0767 [Pirellulaceae bacterium]|nr:MAG: hypothetical protein KatS3mg110_0767 [Pirellulaceae bacterium]
MVHNRPDSRRGGLSLLELLAVVVILGILAGLIVPRFGKQSLQAKRDACQVHKGEIEVQAILWYKATGRWPAGDLSDIGSDPGYFPDGLPVCPVDGSRYRLDSNGRVVGHDHK